MLLKRRFFLSSLFLLVFLGISLLVATDMKNREKDKSFVDLSTTKNETIVFYREDCKDCQKVFPYLYFADVTGRNLKFVNLNNQKNRRYIDEYQLESVPTFVKKNMRYSGTGIDEINHFLNE